MRLNEKLMFHAFNNGILINHTILSSRALYRVRAELEKPKIQNSFCNIYVR